MTQRDELLQLDRAQDILDDLRDELARPRITQLGAPPRQPNWLLRAAIALPLTLLLGVQLGLHSDRCQPQPEQGSTARVGP